MSDDNRKCVELIFLVAVSLIQNLKLNVRVLWWWTPLAMATIMLDHKMGGMLDHDLIEENL